MATVFTELNALTKGSDGVFAAAQSKPFDYSDGGGVERQLRQILSDASDLSSDSNELASQIADWPTEYHLSPTRANLLRCLDLRGASNVLELGSGCGSLSRYLGEQPGMQVEAIEGSHVRASLAALRCRDLDNVTISTGNFNEMLFPDNHYDLVLLVGVTEYAGRFSERATDREALQDLLRLAKRACNENGKVVIAIENRVGLKYMMGAAEDHYGVAYIGIDNYPQPTGIRTYTKAEWLAEISAAGFSACHFAYPFPDYKVPTLVVTDPCASTHSALRAALAKIRSRDYVAPFDLGEQEPRLWQAIIEAEALGEFSNSFLILLGNEIQQLKRILNFDMIEYPQTVRVSATAHSADISPASRSPDKIPSSKQLLIERDVLKLHAEQLQQKVDMMTRSRGWRLLNRVRKLLGRPRIIK